MRTLLLRVFLGLSYSSAQTVGVTHTMSDFDVDGARPLNEALTAIEEQLSIPINYEEAVITDQRYLVKGEQIGLPAGRPVSQGRSLDDSLRPKREQCGIGNPDRVRWYQRNGLPGTYKVSQEDNTIEVFPTGGTPLYRTKVSLPETIPTIPELIDEISVQVGKAAGKPVVKFPKFSHSSTGWLDPLHLGLFTIPQPIRII